MKAPLRVVGATKIVSSPAVRITTLLETAKLTGAELARRVDVHPNTVSNWTSGKSDPPGAVIAYLELLIKVRALAQ